MPHSSEASFSVTGAADVDVELAGEWLRVKISLDDASHRFPMPNHSAFADLAPGASLEFAKDALWLALKVERYRLLRSTRKAPMPAEMTRAEFDLVLARTFNI